MNDLNLFTEIIEIDFVSLLFPILVIAFFLVGLIELWEKIKSKLGFETKSMKERTEKVNALHDIEILKEQRKEDVAQSIAHDKRIEESVTGLKLQLESVLEIIEEMIEKNQKTELAKLKDRIYQSYRYYSTKSEWTINEKETFLGLVDEYTELGGNSFVHTHIVPECYTWKITE